MALGLILRWSRPSEVISNETIKKYFNSNIVSVAGDKR